MNLLIYWITNASKILHTAGFCQKISENVVWQTLRPILWTMSNVSVSSAPQLWFCASYSKKLCALHMLTLSRNKKPYKSGWPIFVHKHIPYTVLHLQLKHMKADYAVKSCLPIWLSHPETVTDNWRLTVNICLHFLSAAKRIKE